MCVNFHKYIYFFNFLFKPILKFVFTWNFYARIQEFYDTSWCLNLNNKHSYTRSINAPKCNKTSYFFSLKTILNRGRLNIKYQQKNWRKVIVWIYFFFRRIHYFIIAPIVPCLHIRITSRTNYSDNWNVSLDIV